MKNTHYLYTLLFCLTLVFGFKPSQKPASNPASLRPVATCQEYHSAQGRIRGMIFRFNIPSIGPNDGKVTAVYIHNTPMPFVTFMKGIGLTVEVNYSRATGSLPVVGVDETIPATDSIIEFKKFQPCWVEVNRNGKVEQVQINQIRTVKEGARY